MKSYNTKKLILISLFSAIEIILMLTPLSFIPIGPIRATTLHIPVILAGILLGSSSGAAVGLVFGLMSLIINTLQPTLTSFVFSPFITIGGANGNITSLFIAFGPRIFLGWFSGILYKLFTKLKMKDNLAIILTTAINTFIHTVSVLLMIYLFFGQSYAAARSVEYDRLLWIMMGIIGSNGILELIIACILVFAVVKALNPILKWRNKKNEE